MLVKQSKMKQKKKCLGLSILVGTLAGSLLGNQLTGKGVKVKIPRRGVIGASTIREGQDF